ncbi:MAG TPA: chemotaxis protein CheA [Rhodocyclaceae bacterium]|nr:chemotaxis protein CheA [Rhodocyclaceae bacterium]
MNLDEALQTFITESRELLSDMESALLSIEQSPGDTDLINAIFRTAHTIKGSAGLFGLNHIVAFTHVMESVLDRVRNNELPLSADLAALLLHSGDHLSLLVEALDTGNAETPEHARAAEAELKTKLSGYLGNIANDDSHTLPVPEQATRSVESAAPTAEENRSSNEHWHLSLRFNPELLRNGMDPISVIRYLGTQGELVKIITLIEAIPPLAEMDPETNYLGFEISLKSEADKTTLESVFEFVQEDSRIRILPPYSKTTEYLALIAADEKENQRLGEILVRCGCLTEHELAQALALQANTGVETRPLGTLLVEEEILQPVVVEAALVKQKQHAERAPAQKTIRIDADKLDELINLIGELVIAGAGLNQVAAKFKGTEIQEIGATIHRLVEEVRDSSLALRMVPIGETFNRFQRVVRDVSHELGKDIALVISGADTELDKSVIEKIGDPLLHLVRNSIDHGIEPEALRLERGKPARGRVELNAYHDSGSVVIEVRDDGGGLNRDRILAKAIERGLVQPGQIPGDEEIFNLIFEAGFSTAEQVTNLSGRGVGMDVVRQNIQALRGSVQVASEAGMGTRFLIRLPLTLAIIDGFLVETGSASFVIPLDAVVECIELDRERLERHYINLRGEVLPFVSLRELFDITHAPPVRENIVVVRSGALKLGISVDVLQGEFQTVIKPLGNLFRHLRGIAGSTILGSGAVALILDVAALGEIATRRENEDLLVTAALR